MKLVLREAKESDLAQLLELYDQLHFGEKHILTPKAEAIWQKILSHPNNTLFVGYFGSKLVTSCHLIVVDNLTHDLRPYALIENIITDEVYRKRGFGKEILDHAKKAAKKAGCYKIMLMTSSKDESTLNFYKKAGYNMKDKTAFVQWLK